MLHPYAPGSTVAERMASRADDGYFVAPHDVMNESSPRRCILIPPPLTELYLRRADRADRAITKFLRTIGTYTPRDFRRFTKQCDLAFYFAAARFVYVHRGQLKHLGSIEQIYTGHKQRILREIDELLDGFVHCAHSHHVALRVGPLFAFAAQLCAIDHPGFKIHPSQHSISAFLSNPLHHVTGRARLGPRFESYMEEVFRDETHAHRATVLKRIDSRLGHGYLIDIDAHRRLKSAVRRLGGKSPDYLHFGRRIRALDLKVTLDHARPEQVSKQNTQRIILGCARELEPVFRIAA